MSKPQSAIALGFFDGVHIAHQKIIKSAVDEAAKNNLTPIALSFDASPLEILSPSGISYLTENDEKKALITALGALPDFLPLSRELLSIEPEDFVEKILVNEYNIKYAVCGYNYRFGKGGRGNTDMLRELGGRYGFSVKICQEEKLHGQEISSSRIRGLISDGRVCEANELLGRNYSLCGTVCEGKRLGHKLGFPTANVFPSASAVLPQKGVYKTVVTIDNERYVAITNTGINPTVGTEKFRTETYIPGFSGNLYGKEIKIEFISFIRKEMKFDSLDELKSQISRDLETL